MGYMTPQDKLCLLNGSPLKRGHLSIYPPTINELVEMTYESHSAMMVIFMTDIHDFYKDANIPAEELSELTFIDLMLRQESEFKEAAINALKTYFRQDFSNDILLDPYGVMIQGQPLTSERWEDIRFLIMEMNDLKTTSEVEPVFTNAKAKEIWMKQKKAEEARKKSASQGANSFEDMLCGLISSVCSKSNTVTYLNVGELNIHQLNDHLSKLIEIEAYDLNMMFAAHGAEIKDNKHWTESQSEKSEENK